jgi:hypothetical protein
MKKIIILLIGFSSIFGSINQKTVIIPLADAYPSRYNYHTEFLVDRHDVDEKWLCRGSASFRFQHSFHEKKLASMLFPDPLLITPTGTDNTFHGQTLGIGFETCQSTSSFSCSIINDFINCKIEVSKINSPWYLQLGIPIARSNHLVTMKEDIETDNKVIKGGFAQEYKASEIPDFQSWKTTPSQIIESIHSMKDYLKGKTIGNMEPRFFGLLTEQHMTLWSLADIYIQIGHEGIHTESGHFGVYFKGIIPTTPTLKEKWNRYIFFPTIGNVNRGEIGGGINGNWLFFDNDASACKLYIDGYAGYLFPAKSQRPFDLKSGPFTRYGGIKVFDRYDLNYKNRLLWATDLTTQTASIGSCFKSECVLDLIYRKFQSSFNLSYSFKSQSKEEIQDTRDCFIRTNNAYANSMQTFVQTPNPVTQNSWTTNLITPDANLTNIPEKAISFFQNNTLYGTPVKPGYIMTENDIDYDSGLMNTQILNIISGGYNYESIYETFVTNFGIKGGVGISPTTAYTPEFWELVASMEINY